MGVFIEVPSLRRAACPVQGFFSHKLREKLFYGFREVVVWGFAEGSPCHFPSILASASKPMLGLVPSRLDGKGEAWNKMGKFPN